jgi:hypothetical protein
MLLFVALEFEEVAPRQMEAKYRSAAIDTTNFVSPQNTTS